MSLFSTYNLPFAIAFGLMALVLLFQLIGLGDFDVDADLDPGADAGMDGDVTSAGFGGALLTLFGLGKVPLMVWLLVFLLAFALIGMSLQAFAISLTGGPLYPALAALIAAGASLPVTSVLVRPLGRLLPRDETSAVGLDSLVGKRGTITEGTARSGSPARAKVYDHHGQAHYVMVEPHEAGNAISAGEAVLIVRREGQAFFAMALSPARLGPINN